MRMPAFVAALALAAVPLLGVGLLGGSALAQTSSGAATWPIVSALTDVDIQRADAAIATAGAGPLGATVGFFNSRSGLNGTIVANADAPGRRRATCRTFQVVVFLQAQYQSSWVLEPRWVDPFRRSGGAVERETMVRPQSNPRFTWTACRAADGSWAPA
jgi:hypothetical protein